MSRVAIEPELVTWARERAGFAVADLSQRFAKLPLWESGELQPTFKQLQAFASATHVPFGYLFLPEPPQETLPLPDFRTLKNHQPVAISPDLRDTIYIMQRRQAWLRDERADRGAESLGFVGSARLTDDPVGVGREMRRVVGLDGDWASRIRTWQQAVGRLRATIEQLGVMAVINGVVGNNTRRVLDVREFRGFALTDALAPVIFVNGADAKSAQMFTLSHELAHLWLGPAGEGISGFDHLLPDGGAVETFCDRAAAEFLVPEAELSAVWPLVRRDDEPFGALARRFKVSPIVAGRRAMDLRLISRAEFFAFYRIYTAAEHATLRHARGGDFYNNQNARVGRMFATEVMSAAKEGRIGFKEAYDLTGLGGGTFQEYVRRLATEMP